MHPNETEVAGDAGAASARGSLESMSPQGPQAPLYPAQGERNRGYWQLLIMGTPCQSPGGDPQRGHTAGLGTATPPHNPARV